MFQGNWTCSKCGGDIKELPFEPRSNSGLTCRDCYFNSKNGDSAGTAADDSAAAADVDTGAAGEMDDRDVPDFDPGAIAGEPTPESPDMADAPAATGEKKMFTGDWHCSVCGGSITQLPFEPRSTDGLKCIDCFKNSKN